MALSRQERKYKVIVKNGGRRGEGISFPHPKNFSAPNYYNTKRPHSALGYRLPAPEAIQLHQPTIEAVNAMQ